MDICSIDLGVNLEKKASSEKGGNYDGKHDFNLYRARENSSNTTEMKKSAKAKKSAKEFIEKYGKKIDLLNKVFVGISWFLVLTSLLAFTALLSTALFEFAQEILDGYKTLLGLVMGFGFVLTPVVGMAYFHIMNKYFFNKLDGLAPLQEEPKKKYDELEDLTHRPTENLIYWGFLILMMAAFCGLIWFVAKNSSI